MEGGEARGTPERGANACGWVLSQDKHRAQKMDQSKTTEAKGGRSRNDVQ